MKLFLIAISLVVLGAALWGGFTGHIGVLTFGFFAFAALLFAANLDRISEFKASGSGIEARTREVLNKTENTLGELQILAKQIGTLTLSLVKRNGRIGGYSDDEQDAIKQSVLGTLHQVGISEREFPEILDEWHKFTEFDYAHAILGGHSIPENVTPVVLEDWRKLRNGGIIDIPVPDQIREFMNKHRLLNEELDEYIKDYEYYREHRVHRRPENWRNREDWGRLKNS